MCQQWQSCTDCHHHHRCMRQTQVMLPQGQGERIDTFSFEYDYLLLSDFL